MLVFASCDIKYYKEHAKALIKSAVENGHRIHVQVLYPNEEYIHSDIYQDYSGNVTHHFLFNQSIKREDLACARFLAAPALMELTYDSLLIVDVDCIFRKPFPEPKEADFGLFLRESLPGTVGIEAAGSKVAAGIVYVNRTPKGKEFIQEVAHWIKSYPDKPWFYDQYTLHQVFLNFAGYANVKTFTQEHMDWEFTPDSYIWTGKGNRKYTNETYLKAKHEQESRNS